MRCFVPLYFDLLCNFKYWGFTQAKKNLNVRTDVIDKNEKNTAY